MQTEQQYRNALDKISTQQMELPSIILEQLAFSTGPEIQESILLVMKKSTHEEHLTQPIQTNNNQFKLPVIFSTGYKCLFNVKDKNIQLFYAKSVTDKDGFI